jgi:glycosyltransferase involved in cell wall biosynthesis
MTSEVGERFNKAVIIDTVPRHTFKSIPAPISYFLHRIYTIIAIVAGMLSSPRGRLLYVGLSGSRGQVFDAVAFAVARVLRAQIVVHHHSFAYLDRRSGLTAFTLTVAGEAALHVVLCERMRERLQFNYHKVRKTLVMSNAALLSYHAGGIRYDPLTVLGVFGNITLAKGIDRFIELIQKLRNAGRNVGGLVAGPFTDIESRKLVEAAEQAGCLKYIGGVNASGKATFFNTIDILIFPSRYANEAEPFVVHEALSFGVPVVGTERGCIPAIVDSSCGMLLDSTAGDLSSAMTSICTWIDRPDELVNLRMGAQRRARELAGSASFAKTLLFDYLQNMQPNGLLKDFRL